MQGSFDGLFEHFYLVRLSSFVEHARIQCSREEVVRRSHGVNITGKVKVKLEVDGQYDEPHVIYDYY